MLVANTLTPPTHTHTRTHRLTHPFSLTRAHTYAYSARKPTRTHSKSFTQAPTLTFTHTRVLPKDLVALRLVFSWHWHARVTAVFLACAYAANRVLTCMCCRTFILLFVASPCLLIIICICCCCYCCKVCTIPQLVHVYNPVTLAPTPPRPVTSTNTVTAHVDRAPFIAHSCSQHRHTFYAVLCVRTYARAHLPIAIMVKCRATTQPSSCSSPSVVLRQWNAGHSSTVGRSVAIVATQ